MVASEGTRYRSDDGDVVGDRRVVVVVAAVIVETCGRTEIGQHRHYSRPLNAGYVDWATAIA
jgi:hypothetical protein